jgi:hypothetical protein
MSAAHGRRGFRFERLVALAIADFLERVRRSAFLVTLGLTIWSTYAFLPPNHAIYATLQFEGHRGIYNSAWVGTLVAVLATIFIGFAGFYVIKNAVEHDRRTGVGAVLASTPMSRVEYAIGKWLSNLAVLGSMVAVIAVASGWMQIARAEDPHLDLGALLAPFALLTLPAMAVVAALALVFEMVPLLGGGLGNVAFFFLWIGGISSVPMFAGRGALDVAGLGLVIPGMEEAVHAFDPSYAVGSHHFSMGFNFRAGAEGTWNLATFPWSGIHWNAGLLTQRLAIVALGLGLALCAAALFDRFDSTVRERSARRRPRGVRSGQQPRAPATGGRFKPVAASLADAPPVGRIRPGWLSLTLAEVTLMARSAGPWWKLVAAGLALAGFLAPIGIARVGILPVAAIWPLQLWSALGHREIRHGTAALVFSTPRPIARPLATQWIAGAVLALAIGAGPLVRAAIAGDTVHVGAQLAGALFIPAFALACGAWSGSARLFEVLYAILWYGGPLNRAQALDYLGVHAATAAGAGGWTALALLSMALAVAARRLGSGG